MKNSPTVDYVIRLSNAEGRLASDYMSYETDDANEHALDVFERARHRVTGDDLDTTPVQQSQIDAFVAAIDANIAIINRRGGLAPALPHTASIDAKTEV